MAVDLFFALSGFIFFLLYAERVRERRVGAAEFGILRLSRLYPLHLATLLLVAVVQLQVLTRSGDFFVYPLNDVFRFIAQLFFLSGSASRLTDSFNAPVWSVSVEMLLYAAFFLVFRLRRGSQAAIILLIAFGAWLKWSHLAGRGLFAFFLGGLACQLYSRWERDSRFPRVWMPLTIFVVAAWAATVFQLHTGLIRNVLGVDAGTFRIAANLLVTGLVMPATILLLAVAEALRPNVGRRLSFLGDISYSSYMLHFPLQLLVVAFVFPLGVTSDTFYGTGALATFFVTLIAISLASFHWLERPAQEFIRSRWRRRTHHAGAGGRALPGTSGGNQQSG